MMPKSTTASAPSLSTNMLPGCRSAWKKPSRNTCLKNAPAALRNKASTSCPAAISAARSSTRMPPMRSVVSTVRPVRSQSIRGTRKLVSPAKFSASSEAAAASKRRSISSCTDCASVSTTSTGFSRRKCGWVRSARRASHKNRSRSRAIARAIPGRNTLTATSAPSVVLAKCNCAIEAAAAAKELEHRAGFRPPRSEPPGGMQRGDAAGQIAELDPLEPGRRNQLRQFALRRKSPDALDEIGIGVAVAGDDLAEPRQELKAVELVEGLQERGYPRGEFA